MSVAKPTTRLTISLPASLVEAIDHFLARDTSRSGAVREVLERAIAEARERELVEQWVRGYQESPQTEEELGWVDIVAAEVLSRIPYGDQPLNDQPLE